MSEDFWLDIESVAVQRADRPLVLQIEDILKVEPLDKQFGVDPKRSVPDVLRPAVFGGQDGASQCFAILDAGKVENLPEMLATSGLEYRCLFKGETAEELSEVAPWLVRLEDGNKFTMGLFTRSNAPWHLWGRQPGLYLRSSASFDQLWQHLRKFTRICDEAGNWFYFRFWDNGSLIDYLRYADGRAECDLRPIFGFDAQDPSRPLVRSYIHADKDRAVICTATRISGHNTRPRTEFDMPVLRFLTLRNHAHRFADSFFADHTISPETRRRAHDAAVRVALQYHAYGFKSRYHLGSFVYWTLALSRDFKTASPRIQQEISATKTDAEARFVAISREMKALFGNKIRNFHGHRG